MGNDLSYIYKRHGLNDIERENADYLFTNALKRINDNDLSKPFKIIGYGRFNIVICTDGLYYRIAYHARSDEAIERMRYKYDIIKSNDYGFVLPLRAEITQDYVYYHIRMVNERPGKITYEELRDLFSKLMRLGENGLAWIDYHKRNIRRLNGKLVIIDFDCWDKQDVSNYIDIVLKAYNVPHDPAIVRSKLLNDTNNSWRLMKSRELAALFSVVHGYEDPGRFMRLTFNAILYRKKHCGINRKILTKEMYDFMIHRPFSLL